MQPKFSKIPDLGRKWFTTLGAEVSDRIVIHTTKGRKDVNDRRFKSLDPEYAKRKSSGKIRRAGKQRGVANLSLTGDMMSNLQTRRVTDRSVTIGWDGVEASKLIDNAQNGRVVTKKSKPIAKGVERYIQKEIDKKTKRNIKKNDTVNIIKLGR